MSEPMDPVRHAGMEVDVEGQTSAIKVDNNVAAMLAYLPISPLHLLIPLLWLVTEPKEARFVRFHSVQSLLFQVVWVVVAIALAFLTTLVVALVSATIGGLVGGLLSLTFTLISLAWAVGGLVALVLAMVRAFQGKAWHIPLVGEWAEKIVAGPTD